jgi:hypothetical protein
MVGLLFIGLAIWRIVKKKSTVKEVIVMKLLHIALGLGFGLLFPYYLAVFLIVGLLFLIISRIHISAIRNLIVRSDRKNLLHERNPRLGFKT